jgi:hypothetical protein
VTVINKSSENLVIKTTVAVENEDLAALDEYVYSIRKPPTYEYNEK